MRVLRGQASHYSQTYSPLYEYYHFTFSTKVLQVYLDGQTLSSSLFFLQILGYRYIVYRLFACRFSFKLTFAPALPRHRKTALCCPFLAEQHKPSTEPDSTEANVNLYRVIISITTIGLLELDGQNSVVFFFSFFFFA